MIITSFSRRRLARTAALAAGALLTLSGPAARAAPAEPEPPDPRPLPPATQLDRAGTQVGTLPEDVVAPQGVSALSWLVADAKSGEVLAAHDAHRKLPPASTLKSLFALTVLPQLSPDTRHEVTQRDLAGVGEGSSLVGVAPGHSYRVADLWRGVFLSSGNDAVHVLSSMVGGERAAVRQMQAKATALGARDTHVVSPDGYDQPGQVSSAYDLAVFGRAGLADKDFAAYCSTAFAQFPGDGKVASYAIQNTNRLLTGADGVAPYTGLLGIKNGYTTNAGNTLIVAAHRGARTILVTVMHPTSGEPHAVYTEARSLLDWGFTTAGRVRPVGTLAPVRPAAPTPPPAQAGAAPAPARADGGSPVMLTVGAAGGTLLAAGGVVLFLWRRARERASSDTP